MNNVSKEVHNMTFLKKAWDGFVERFLNGEFWFDLYLAVYKWLRSCLLNTDNLREVLFPRRYYESSSFQLSDLLKILMRR
uniref:Uncharacterized protein n=1 Tax=Trichobilharzia regenti TaxID=157069 RepID=A0AA85J3J6_TRIRE|nr:unnamed protein product [Trichobilharzia regenti]